MTITIITATYNSAEHILSCLRSVAQQDYPFIEHLIMDGCSSDNTVQLIQDSGYLDREGVSLFCEADQGIYDALNKGIARAKSEVVGFLHSDDLFASSNSVSQIMSAFKNNRCDGVYGDLCYVQQDNAEKTVRYWKSAPFSPEMLRKGWMPPHPTLYLKKQIYQIEGGFNLDFKIAADYEFVLRIFGSGKYTFKYLPQVLVHMRMGGLSNRGISNLIRKSREDLRAIRMHKIGGIEVLFKKIFSKIGQFSVAN